MYLCLFRLHHILSLILFPNHNTFLFFISIFFFFFRYCRGEWWIMMMPCAGCQFDYQAWTIIYWSKKSWWRFYFCWFCCFFPWDCPLGRPHYVLLMKKESATQSESQPLVSLMRPRERTRFFGCWCGPWAASNRTRIQ